MQSALEQFQISINRVRGLIAIYRTMENQAVATPDPSDILRAALVLSVSALDYAATKSPMKPILTQP